MIKRILLSFVVALSSVMATFANSLNGDNPSKYSYYSCNIQVKDNTSFNYRPSNFPKIIYSFSIDGQISIEKEDYLVRVLLSDANGKEYLVMESYKEIRGNVPSQFEDYSEESFRLDGISIDSIKVYTRGVSLQIKGLRCLTEKESLEKNNSILTNYRKKQSLEDNVRRINEYNEKNRKLWYADVTWLSQQSYEVKKRVPVYAGTGCPTTKETITLSKEAEEIGADVLSVIVPYFAAASQDELYDHFKAVAESVKIPVVLYNIPARTGNALAPATVARLAKDVPNILGAKDSSGNFDNMKQYIELTSNIGKDFSVLSGNDSLILPALVFGGKGGIAGCANVFPRTMVEIYEALRPATWNARKKFRTV